MAQFGRNRAALEPDMLRISRITRPVDGGTGGRACVNARIASPASPSPQDVSRHARQPHPGGPARIDLERP